MARLYTRSGDDGSTGLFSGTRVGKDHPRVRAYGEVDELNAALGLAGAEASRAAGDAGASKDEREAIERLGAIAVELQSRLFDVGADLATPAGGKNEAKVSRIEAADVARLESLIDEVEAGNEPLRAFVLPGGCELAARLHLARTVARRAERSVIALSREEDVGAEVVRYLNRASDLLFAMARRANRARGVADVPWRGGA